eukprot:CAMPEP_0204622130 /NCGR_PEP_ID=MMETSP0717-20131115/7787_1 /ASSEMBLY_ACC=CAM_ASM_000666 /TAXON_ID=230516 /ORGANISM="Chaetoceros curvisetus" /LENGTH=111 /DNA_ID=CAMNT_0051636755 /DNA_START=54 /DNA_END=389 /DNA_ORIENTATION=+
MNVFHFSIALSVWGIAQAFVPSMHASMSSSTALRDGKIEQIEFKIFPDGRIEETVRGIKGGECHKVTEEINNNLGKVTASNPTEEMFEQEIVINQNVEVKNDSGWEGSSSW